jgi:hypothetical protein
VTFERVAPQVVRHSSGFTVQITDRYHIEYIEGDRVASVTADLDGPTVRLHGGSVAWSQPTPGRVTEEERITVLDRIRDGVRAMGDACEVV